MKQLIPEHVEFKEHVKSKAYPPNQSRNFREFTQSQTVKIDKLHEDVEATLKLLSDAADEMKVQDNTDHALTKVEVGSVLNDHQAAIEQQEKFAQVFDNRLTATAIGSKESSLKLEKVIVFI